MITDEILFTNPIKETLNNLSEQIDGLTTRAEMLAEENRKLRKDAQGIVSDEIRKENEYLKKRLELSFGEFNSEKEYKDYLKFVKAHKHNRDKLKIEAGKAPYIITYGTGLGPMHTVVCQICGEKKDITDTRAW